MIGVDADHFDETNLNRQALSSQDALGHSKADEAATIISSVNAGVKVTPHHMRIDTSNASQLLSGADVVVDALDNIQDRLDIEGVVKTLGIPLVHGAVAGFEAQIMTIFPEDEGLKKLYGETAPSRDDKTSPEKIFGVPAITPALLATLQAMEVLKIVLNRGNVFRKKMIHLDLEHGLWNEFLFSKKT